MKCQFLPITGKFPFRRYRDSLTVTCNLLRASAIGTTEISHPTLVSPDMRNSHRDSPKHIENRPRKALMITDFPVTLELDVN